MKTVWCRVFIAVALVGVTTAAAAKCPDGEWWTIESEFRRAESVLIGEMISERPDKGVERNGNWLDGTFYRLRVKQLLRGKPISFIELYSENSSGRYHMEHGTSYLVFASLCQGRYYAYAKGNTQPHATATTALKRIKHIKNR
jgi:hypothetical protein